MGIIKPVRLQRKRTKGYKMSDSPNGLENVYVGRPTVYGNTFYLKDFETREECLLEYEKNLRLDKQNIQRIKVKLKGKNLVCFCSLDISCHADILLKIANEVKVKKSNKQLTEDQIIMKNITKLQRIVPELWGKKYPRKKLKLCSKIEGDGKQGFILTPLNTRPQKYMLLVDSNHKFEDELTDKQEIMIFDYLQDDFNLSLDSGWTYESIDLTQEVK